MSFDLYFCGEDNSIPEINQLQRFFQDQIFFTYKELESGGVHFGYENEETGVYCSFSYDLEDADPEISQCAATGLSFNINYLRPSFFAYECMPLVEAFCKQFSLNVEDPQEETLGEASASTLITSWRKHNHWAVNATTRASNDPLDLRYFPEDRATYWWSYMRQRLSLENSATEDIFVPKIMLLATRDNQIVTMIVWPDGIPQLFPACDFVFIERTRTGLFGEKKEKGAVPYSEVVQTIEPLLENYPPAKGAIKYLSPAKKNDVAPLLSRLQLRPVELKTYTSLSADSFHDVELPNG